MHIEATVAAVYQHARSMLHLEIDEQQLVLPTLSWRRLVLDAGKDLEEHLQFLPDNLSSRDKDGWNAVIGRLERMVVWYHDIRNWNGSGFSPMTDESSSPMKVLSEDYFSDVLPDPADDVNLYLDALKSLILLNESSL